MVGRSNNSCSISVCKNTGRNNKEVIFHTFPKDKEFQKQWVIRCKRLDKINVNYARVCSAHFLPEDYARDLRGELLRLPLKKRLKAGAVPSQNLANSPGSDTPRKKGDIERELRQQKRDASKRLMTLKQSLTPNKETYFNSDSSYAVFENLTNELCSLENEQETHQQHRKRTSVTETVSSKKTCVESDSDKIKMQDAEQEEETDLHSEVEKLKEELLSIKMENAILKKCNVALLRSNAALLENNEALKKTNMILKSLRTPAYIIAIDKSAQIERKDQMFHTVAGTETND